MPQGRRKTPFSGKQKKAQIAQKRQTKQTYPSSRYNDPDDLEGDDAASTDPAAASQAVGGAVQKINYQSADGGGSAGGSKANRYALQFYKETDKQLRAMRDASQKPLVYAKATDLEVDSHFFDGYDFPKRPEWSYRMSKEQLNSQENRYFTEYVMKLERFHADADKVMSYFELNLETWRQLWRVLEISDIILVIVDIRYPTLMFPPSLFDYVTKVLRKNMILVLNKVDLVPAHVVVAWQKYFEEKYGDISLVFFTSYPGYNLRNVTGWTKGLKIRRRKGKQRMAIEGAQQVFDACKRIVQDEVDVTSWAQKIAEESRWLDEKLSRFGGAPSGTAAAESDSDDEDDNPKVKYERTHVDDPAFDFEEHVRYKDGTLTVGCVGFPNVGKSSVLNALMGRKVVSVSKTPGHTKHFQTIFLTNNVRLCDCPGLVFPSYEPRPLQVLLGSFPIAQLRVPNASVKYLAERVNLPELLNVEHPAGRNQPWSAADVCEAWAYKRGYLTAKAGRPDVSRAANSILRMALEGQISLALLPPGFSGNEEMWRNHPGVKVVEDIQAFGKMEDAEPVAVTEAEVDEESSGSDGGDDDDDDEDSDRAPVVRNAFAMLNDDD